MEIVEEFFAGLSEKGLELGANAFSSRAAPKTSLSALSMTLVPAAETGLKWTRIRR
jgi:hypothetical protein